jgi:hypothetical protein
MSTPTLRPLSTAELLDRTFALYRSHFLLFAGISAVTNLVALAVQLVGVGITGTPTGATLSAAGCFGMLIWVPFMLVVTLAVNAASQGATVIAVSHVYLGRPITVTEALSRIRGRIASLAVTWVVLGIATALGLLLFIVPGVILMLMWGLAIPVAVLEHRSMLDAGSRSADLTAGDRFRVFVIWAMFFALYVVVAMVINIPLGIVGVVTGGLASTTAPWVQVTSNVASFFTQCLVGPLMTIGFALLYYDERVRKEAFDLELMMAAIDGPPADASA